MTVASRRGTDASPGLVVPGRPRFPKAGTSAPEPPSPTQVRLARTTALLAFLGATYSALLSATSSLRHDQVIVAAAVVLPCYAIAAILMARAKRASKRMLALMGSAAVAFTGVATTLAVVHQPGSQPVGLLDHRGWAMGLGVLLFAILVVYHLLTELSQRVELLNGLARIDPLTTIANRRGWDEELERELARAHREGSSFCVAMIDLDNFKRFNDMRGHQEGDRLLREIGNTWSQSVRRTDFLARVGGEEFALMLRNCRLDDALPIVELMRAATGEGQTCSVGLTVYGRGDAGDDIMARADAALYEAKASGRDRVRVWSGDEAAPTLGTRWPAVVTQVLRDRSVVAAYQPVVRLADGDVVAYEGLARPNRKQVDISVEDMFSTAERMGLGRDLDWLCRRAALVGARTMPAGIPLFINCGLSGLIDPVHRVDQMLLLCEAVGRRPQDLVLEITERELFGDLRRLREVVNTYRREKFRFAIDDVGEGHSTLEVLSVTEPEFVKVARSLVVGSVTRGPRAAIRAVVAFAAELGADVIAEGVELPQTATYLREMGVGYAQGWLFGRPVIPTHSGEGEERFQLHSKVTAGSVR